MNYSPCGWMILWLDDTDWLTGDLFTQWLNYPVTDWPIDLVIFNQSIKIYLVLFNIVTGWPCNWLLLWLIDQWLIDPLTNTVWLNDPVSERHWLIGWWLNDPLTKWPSDWKTLTGDWLTQWLIDPMTDWPNDCFTQRSTHLITYSPYNLFTQSPEAGSCVADAGDAYKRRSRYHHLSSRWIGHRRTQWWHEDHHQTPAQRSSGGRRHGTAATENGERSRYRQAGRREPKIHRSRRS